MTPDEIVKFLSEPKFDPKIWEVIEQIMVKWPPPRPGYVTLGQLLRAMMEKETHDA